MASLTRKRISVFDIINISFMAAVCLIIVYPLWFSIVYSLNDGKDTVVNGINYFFPRKITFENYTVLFRDDTIPKAFGISVARTVIGTALHVYFTAMVAYALTKTYLPGRKLYLGMATISMFFSGGLIPYYMLIKKVGLIDNFFVYIIPLAFNFYDALIFMGFFRNIPDSIEESAKMDGANDFLIFWKLIIPLSTPVIATIMIFNGVAHWNDFFYGFMFINKKTFLIPMQTFLYQMVTTTDAYSKIPELSNYQSQVKVTPESIRVAVMVVTTAPIVVVYPFLQKYFTKGIMLGAVKG